MFDENAKIRQKAYNLEKELKDVYKETFLSNKGKMVLADLMKACNTFKRATTSSSEINMYERGTQDVVSRILEMVDLTIDELLKNK